METDPVCGMTVDPKSAAGSAEFQGTTYWFCSPHCLAKFKVEPQRFAGSAPPPGHGTAGHAHAHQAAAHAATAGVGEAPARGERLAAPEPGATIYTCPMHPQVRQPTPGHCPICGMALEPLLPSLEEEENPELVDFTRRFWWTLPLTAIVVSLAMFGHRIAAVPAPALSWIEFALAAPVILWGGWPFFVRGVQSMVHRSPNMWTLIGLGVAAAFAYSAAATVAPDLFPDSFVVHGRVGVYFEAAAVIVSLTLLGQVLELRARSKTSAAIKALLGLAPKTARRLRDDGTEEDIPLAHVHVGDRLRVRPGEQINIKVLLRPYRGAPFIHEIPVTIPAQASRGTLRVLVSDAATLNRIGNFLASNTSRLAGLGQLITLINRERRNHQLYVTLLQPNPTLVVEDKELPNAPLSQINVLDQQRKGGASILLRESVIGEWSAPLGQVITGQHSILITVK